jgi:hypothetical protein
MDPIGKCPACDATISANDKECPDCGLNLSIDEADLKEWFCPVCRAFIKGRASECPSCRAEFDDEGNLVIHRIDDHLKEGEKRLANFPCQLEATKCIGEIVITDRSFYFLGSNASFSQILIRQFVVFGIFFLVPAAFLGVTLKESAMFGIAPWFAIISIAGSVTFSSMHSKKVSKIVGHLSMDDVVFEARKDDLVKCESLGSVKFRVYQKSGLNPDFHEFGLSRYDQESRENRESIIECISRWISAPA